MAQDMKDPNFKQQCAQIWPDIANHSTIDKFTEKVAIHSKSVFLGYADVTFGAKLASGHVTQYKLRGLEVKMLGGKPHIDPPSERGSDNKYYPHFFPKTAVDRQILTTLVFSDARIASAVQTAAAQIEAQSQPAASDEPSTGEEPVNGAVGAQVANPFA